MNSDKNDVFFFLPISLSFDWKIITLNWFLKFVSKKCQSKKKNIVIIIIEEQHNLNIEVIEQTRFCKLSRSARQIERSRFLICPL